MKNKNKFFSRFAVVGVLTLLTACGNKENADTESEVESDPAVAAESGAADAPLVLETADDKISYIIGYEMAKGYGNDPVLKFDRDLLVRGVDDALAGQDAAISREVATAAGQELQNRLAASQALAAQAALKESEAYFAANKEKDGVVETESGLQYEVLTKGDSDQSPVATDTVTVHYHGTLTDGTVFDSSVERGSPSSFPLNGVIAGWTEGLQLMSIGDKFRFYIPSELAYGPRATGSIPANSPLIFDVELLKIGE